jgi:hypothetical protein
MPAADGVGGVAASRRKSLDDPAFYPNQTCGPASFLSSVAHDRAQQQQQQQQREGSGFGDLEAAPAAAAGGGEPPAADAFSQNPPQLKRIRTDGFPAAAGAALHHGRGSGGMLLPLSPHGVLLPGLSPRFDSHLSSPTTEGSTSGCIKPIDHIFQFHKALR